MMYLGSPQITPLLLDDFITGSLTRGQQVTLPCYLCMDGRENHCDSAWSCCHCRYRAAWCSAAHIIQLYFTSSVKDASSGPSESWKKTNKMMPSYKARRHTHFCELYLSPIPGLSSVESTGRHAGEWRPQRGGGGGLHASPRAAAGLHQVPLQPGHQLH